MAVTGWRRDAAPLLLCLCGHASTEHRLDLKASSPCSRGGCGCQHMRPAVQRWREHRWVDEPVAERVRDEDTYGEQRTAAEWETHAE